MALPIHLLRHFCRRIYRLATMTDGGTDRTYHANSRSHSKRYDRL